MAAILRAKYSDFIQSPAALAAESRCMSPPRPLSNFRDRQEAMTSTGSRRTWINFGVSRQVSRNPRGPAFELSTMVSLPIARAMASNNAR